MMRPRELPVKKHVHTWKLLSDAKDNLVRVRLVSRECTDCRVRQKVELRQDEYDGVPDSLIHLADSENWKTHAK
jgi:hypothetical protein